MPQWNFRRNTGWSQGGDVWTSPGEHPCARSSHQTFEAVWIRAKQTDAWPVEVQLEAYSICINCPWFCCEVCWQGAYGALGISYTWVLQLIRVMIKKKCMYQCQGMFAGTAVVPTPKANKTTNSPHPHIPQVWCQGIHEEAANEPPMPKKWEKFIQHVLGTFLFYVWAINRTMLIALNTLAAEQAKPTSLNTAPSKRLQ